MQRKNAQQLADYIISKALEGEDDPTAQFEVDFENSEIIDPKYYIKD